MIFKEIREKKKEEKEEERFEESLNEDIGNESIKQLNQEEEEEKKGIFKKVHSFFVLKEEDF